jgi:hypothetical protein
MAPPQAFGKTHPTVLASWLERLEANNKRRGLEPGALVASTLQKVKNNTDGAERYDEEHAKRMGVKNINDVVEKLVVGTPHPLILISERPTKHSPNENVIRSVEELVSPPDLEMDSSDMQTSREPGQGNTMTQAPNTKAPAMKRKQSKSKKESERSKSAKLSMKSSSKSASPTTGFAEESSKNSAIHEATGVTTGPMDVDHTPSLFVESTNPYPIYATLPKWHTEISMTNIHMKALAKRRTQTIAALDALKDCIGRCEVLMSQMKTSGMGRPGLAKLFDELRDHVHKAESILEVNKFSVKYTRILTPDNGLPRIFKDDAGFSSDLKADSYMLYSRWMMEDFSTDILRGIIIVKGDNRGSDRLDPAYRIMHPKSAKVYGANGLVLGQWWPTQLCTVRDGAHGNSQGGITGAKDLGAFSIILSGGGGYHDLDDGDVIQYSGTDGKDGEISPSTQHMITSASLGNEIRVIRSSGLSKSNQYRPECGFRYDGLYKIVPPFKVTDKAKQTHRFTLRRCPGQEPIRCENNLARRPTSYEVEQFRASKEKYKW